MLPSNDPNPIPPRPPLPLRRKILIASILILTLAALTFDRNRPRLGTLRVQSEGDAVRITIRQDLREVVASSPLRTFSLLPGRYQVSASDAHTVTPSTVEVRRNQTSFVRVLGPPSSRP